VPIGRGLFELRLPRTTTVQAGKPLGFHVTGASIVVAAQIFWRGDTQSGV
jgi:hypothetical protein